MDDKVFKLLVDEIRENRKELKDLRETVTGLKIKFGIIAGIFGLIGGKLSSLLGFLGK